MVYLAVPIADSHAFYFYCNPTKGGHPLPGHALGRPYEQAAGIGARLLQAGETFAREHQYRSLTITVIDQRHEVIDWYRRKGFVPTGKLEPFANASSAALGEFSFMEMRKELV